MATKTFNARIANKRDTSANWTSNNPVLLNGEVIIVDTEAGQVRYKVGNGTSTYTQLPFTDESLITNINGKLSLSGGTMTGNINMGGHKLTGLGAPVNSNDAVRQADLKVVSDEVDGIIAGTTGITLAPATTTKIGGVIVGDGIEVEADGTISTNPVPDGGAEGQMLYKTADGTEWGDKPVMVVNVTDDETGTFSADKTVDEIKEAYLNGLNVYVLFDNIVFSLASAFDAETGTPRFLFYAYLSSNSGETLTKLYNISIEIYKAGAADKVGLRSISGGLFPMKEGNQGEILYLANDDEAHWGPAPKGIPSGGTTGQVLTKTSTGEEWSDAPSGLPEGGTEGQILEKTSSGAAWVDAPESGLTQEQADERYLQLTGGTLTGSIMASFGQDFGIFFDESDNNIHIGAGCPAFSVSANNVVEVDFEPTTANGVVNKAYVDSKFPTSVTVTLTASGWSSNTQTVTVSGVSATETAQLITPTPVIASQSAYYEAGIMCTGQAANSLTFTCQTVPTSNLTVYVVIQPLS